MAFEIVGTHQVKPFLGPCPTFVSDIDAAEAQYRLLGVREIGSSATRLIEVIEVHSSLTEVTLIAELEDFVDDHRRHGPLIGGATASARLLATWTHNP